MENLTAPGKEFNGIFHLIIAILLSAIQSLSSKSINNLQVVSVFFYIFASSNSR